jgi:glutathione S-transferase
MGEPVRLLLELGGFDWEDKLVDFKTWGEGTLKKQAQWGQMPYMLLEDGTQFTQSRAMVKFLANYVTVSGTPLMPSDPMVVYQVDMLMDAFEDMLNKLRKTFATADAAEKAAEREKLFLPGGECAELFKKMDAVCGADYLVAGQLTYGDLYFYVLVAFLRCGFWQDPAPGVPANFIDAYPKLKGVCDRFGAIPEVKAYYATKSGNKMYAVMQ